MAENHHKNRELLDVLVVLRQIIRANDLHSKHVMKVCGLTVPQLLILMAIDELGEVTVGHLSRHVSLSQATVTTILNRLEQRDFILRHRNDSDKRVVNSRLTARGQAVLRQSPPLMDDRFMCRYRQLPPAVRRDVLCVLRSVARLMDVQGPQQGDAPADHAENPLSGMARQRGSAAGYDAGSDAGSGHTGGIKAGQGRRSRDRETENNTRLRRGIGGV